MNWFVPSCPKVYRCPKGFDNLAGSATFGAPLQLSYGLNGVTGGPQGARLVDVANGNGTSNGHTNGNGNGSGSRAAAPELVVKRLRVLIHRTENEFADAKRLERLSHLLQDEGASPFEVIVAMPDGRFRVSAPESCVRLTADLERQLREDFGAECVLVERG